MTVKKYSIQNSDLKILEELTLGFVKDSVFLKQEKRKVDEIAYRVKINGELKWLRRHPTNSLMYRPHLAEIFRNIEGLSHILYVIDVDFPQDLSRAHKVACDVSEIANFGWKFSGSSGFHGIQKLRETDRVMEDLELVGDVHRLFRLVTDQLVGLIDGAICKFKTDEEVLEDPNLDPSMFTKNRLVKAFSISFKSIKLLGQPHFSVPIDIKNDDLDTILKRARLEIPPLRDFKIPAYNIPEGIRIKATRGEKRKKGGVSKEFVKWEDFKHQFDLNDFPPCIQRVMIAPRPSHKARQYFATWLLWKGYNKQQIHGIIRHLHFNKIGWSDYKANYCSNQLNTMVYSNNRIIYECQSCKKVKDELGLCGDYDKIGLCSLRHPLEIRIRKRKQRKTL